MSRPKPISAQDLDKLRAWSEVALDTASAWAERAEVSKGDRKLLTKHLDSIARKAQEVKSLCEALS